MMPKILEEDRCAHHNVTYQVVKQIQPPTIEGPIRRKGDDESFDNFWT